MHESRKIVTVLFADVVASTELGDRLDPEALRRVVTRYFEEMAAVIEAHGGTVEKFIGDAVMAVFGVPTVHEDDALRAVRAAQAMHSRLRTLNAELEAAWGTTLAMRIGINSGEVVAGDPTAGHGFVSGSVVNVAKRLEEAAEPGEVLLGDATHRLIRHAVTTTPIGPISLRGRREREEPRRLEEVRAEAEALARHLDAPLVGRRGELARLEAAYAQAVDERRARLVTLLGAAGIGKSRLAKELLDRVAGEATTLVGRCPPYGEGITFWPVRQVLPELSLEGTNEEIFWRVRKRAEELSRERPLVICFDDIHWAEPTLLDLLQYLAGWTREAPVLLLCLARSELLELRPTWLEPGSETSEVLVLGALKAEAAEEILAALKIAPDARAEIAAAAEGNPLFVEQMAALTQERGTERVVPPSIRALLAARLDLLGATARTVVEVASVVGRDFSLTAVLHLLPDDLRRSASTVLLDLVRREFVRPSPVMDDGFRFRHALIRDAAYESLPKRLRAELHERHADWLEVSEGDGALVAHHLERAYLARADLGGTQPATDELGLRARVLLEAAGRRASARGDAAAAAGLLRRALALVPASEPIRHGLLVELAEALMRTGALAEAQPLLDEASEQARRAGDRRVELRASIERQVLRSFIEPEGSADVGRSLAETVIPELEALGDDRGLAKAWRMLSDADVTACRWEARASALERALSHALRVPQARHEVTAIASMLALALHYGPTHVDEALDRCRELLADLGDAPDLRAGVHAPLGALLAAGGEFEEARALYASSVALHEELGLRFRRIGGTLLGAEIELLAGDLVAAERELRAAYDELGEIGESGVRAVVGAHLAHVICEAAREDEAESLALAVAAQADPADLAAQVSQRVTRARVLARRGDVGAGEKLARAAAEIADRTDFVAQRALVRVTLAEILERRGDDDRARQIRREARAMYVAKGHTVGVRQLDDLSAPAGASR